MILSVSFVFILIGVVLIFLSAFQWPPRADGKPAFAGISLWNLGWGFVLTGALLVGRGP